MLLDNVDGSNGQLRMHDAAQGAVVSQAASTEYATANMSLNANGTLVAETGYFWTMVRDRQFQRVQADLPGGAVSFSPVFNTLYVLPTNTSTLLAYDATTFQVKATFDLGEQFGFELVRPGGRRGDDDVGGWEDALYRQRLGRAGGERG